MPDRDGEKDEQKSFKRDDRLDPEHSIEATRQMLEHTRAFLDGIQAGDGATRNYLEGLKATLENDLRRLESKRPPRDEED